MKRNSFSVLFVINKSKILKNGETPILLRITVNGIRVESKIKRSIKPELWNQAAELSRGRTSMPLS